MIDICTEYHEDRYCRPKTPFFFWRLDVVIYLPYEGADATCPGLLIACCASRCLLAVQWMVTAGADVNQYGSDKWKNTPLMMTADAPGITRYLLKKGADARAVTNYGNTVLHEQLGPWRGHLADPESVQLLIEAGADVNARNDKGETPLIRGADRAPVETVAQLLKSGADIAAVDNNGKTALDINTYDKRDEVLSSAWLEKFPSDRVHKRDAEGKTFLMKAPGSPAIVNEYLKKSADPHLKDNAGMTVLMHHSRASDNRTEILKKLVQDYHVDIQAADQAGMTALLHAVKEGHYQHSLDLLEWGCNPHVIDLNGCNIMHYVLESSGWTIHLPEFIETGADIDLQDKAGRSPLIKAFLREDPMQVDWLVQAGAKTQGYVDHDGMSPNDYLERLIREKGKMWTPEFRKQVRASLHLPPQNII